MVVQYPRERYAAALQRLSFSLVIRGLLGLCFCALRSLASPLFKRGTNPPDHVEVSAWLARVSSLMPGDLASTFKLIMMIIQLIKLSTTTT